MRRLAPFLLLLPLSGCVAYPSVFMSGRKGQAAVDSGHPKLLKAALIRRCVSVETEDEETVKKEKSFKTDDEGRYHFSMFGVVWTWRNFIKGSSCTGRIQLYDCKDICRQVDEVDLDVLGK